MGGGGFENNDHDDRPNYSSFNIKNVSTRELEKELEIRKKTEQIREEHRKFNEPIRSEIKQLEAEIQKLKSTLRNEN